MEDKMSLIAYLDSEKISNPDYINDYYDFLSYAFHRTDFFMLVYVNYYNKGYTKEMKALKKALEPYVVKKRTNPSWPGTLNTFSLNSTYKVVFYSTAPEAKQILMRASFCIGDWSRPLNPEDLAFFEGNKCWFYSVGHEKIGAVIRATEDDVRFLLEKGLISLKDVFKRKDDYFDAYDEQLVIEA